MANLVQGNPLQSFIDSLPSAESQRLYRVVLSDYFKTEDLREVNLEQIRDINWIKALNYKRELHNRLKKSSVRTYLSVLRSFYSNLEAVFPIKNPWKVKSLRVRTSRNYRPVLTKSEAKELMSKAKNPTSRCLLSLLLNTGIRIAEASKIKLGHFLREDSQIGLRIFGKGEKERRVLVNPSAWREIEDYLQLRHKRRDPRSSLFKTREGKAYTLNGLRNLVRRELKRIDKNMGAHSLRRTYSTLCYEMNCDLISLQRELGHANLSTTQRYIQNQSKLENSPSRLLRW